MSNAAQPYVPALGYRFLTPFYDAVVGLTTREHVFKTALVEQAAIKSGDRVLDVACGTGTLMLMAKRAQPQATLTGLDGDPQMLERARHKAMAAGVDVGLDTGMSTQMPYAEATFDKVLCSLFFHHLDRESKLRTFREISRVLKPGGELHVADWGRAANPLMRAAFVGIQLLDGFPNTADNVAGRLPDFMRDAGLEDGTETARFSTVFGTMSLYRASAKVSSHG